MLTAPLLAPGSAQIVHMLLEWGALALGVQLYRRQRRLAGQGGVLAPGGFAVLIGCILGAAIGNKLVFWVEYPYLWPTGQSIVGGLLGGLLGVEAGKKVAGITGSTGDLFVLPIVAATILGRIGCFLAGLHDATYGVPTALPWGVDFGDGLARHPTQAYEILFVLAWGAWLLQARARWRDRPGLLFKLYLSGYLLWRLAVEAIKPLPYDYGGGISGIQWVCLLALACYLPLTLRQARERA